MAIRNINIKQFVEDRDENVFIGIDLPFRRSDGVEGWFASTSTTIEAVKNNIRNLIQTEKGERLMQPNFGISLKKFQFEQYTNEIRREMENSILDAFQYWLPFVGIQNIVITTADGEDIDKNRINIKVFFKITKNPTQLESVEVNIGD